MKINRACRYEPDPNREQRVRLAKNAGAAGFACNWGVARVWNFPSRLARARTPPNSTGNFIGEKSQSSFEIRREVAPVETEGCRPTRPVPIDEAGTFLWRDI